jgi:hypothetical protein
VQRPGLARNYSGTIHLPTDYPDITLTEHEQILWLDPEELPSLDWTEADLNVIQNYLRLPIG